MDSKYRDDFVEELISAALDELPNNNSEKHFQNLLKKFHAIVEKYNRPICVRCNERIPPKLSYMLIKGIIKKEVPCCIPCINEHRN